MIAIETHYVGPSNTKGGRIVATADKHRHTISYPHELSIARAHCKAASELANKLKWGGRWAGGWTKRGFCFVCIENGTDAPATADVA